MSIYAFDPFRASEELTPPQLRQPKMLAWLRTLLRPLKWVSDLFLDDYCKGSNYGLWDGAVTYVKYDRVQWYDDGVYECRVSSSLNIKPTGHSQSKTDWIKILDDFIGVDEKIKYNGQLIVLEYALNRRFGMTAPPYAYFDAVSPPTPMPTLTINFPVAVYANLGPTNAARKARVLEFVYKYSIGGVDLTVVTY